MAWGRLGPVTHQGGDHLAVGPRPGRCLEGRLAGQRLEPGPILGRHRDPDRPAHPLRGQQRMERSQAPLLIRPSTTPQAILIHVRTSTRRAGLGHPGPTRPEERNLVTRVRECQGSPAGREYSERGDVSSGRQARRGGADGLDEGRDPRGVLDARRRLDAAGDVDHPRADQGHAIGHVLGRQAAGEDQAGVGRGVRASKDRQTRLIDRSRRAWPLTWASTRMA